MCRKYKSKFDAYIGQNRSWWNYYVQYKTVLNEIVRLIESNLPVNTVSLPTLFLIRHGLELAFKANILRFELVSTVREKLEFKGSKSHSLEYLYQVFTDHLNQIIKNVTFDEEISIQIKEFQNKTETLKKHLHELDSGSYNFRYPVDKEGNYNFEWNEKINIAEIITLYSSIHPFLLFTEQVLEEYGVFNEIEEQ